MISAVGHQLVLLAAATEDPVFALDRLSSRKNCVDVSAAASYATAALQGDHRE